LEDGQMPIIDQDFGERFRRDGAFHFRYLPPQIGQDFVIQNRHLMEAFEKRFRCGHRRSLNGPQGWRAWMISTKNSAV
jgi:hypothetical protein